MTSTTITTQLGLIKTNEIDLKKVEKDIKKIIHTDPCCNMDYVYDNKRNKIKGGINLKKCVGDWRKKIRS